MLAGHTARDQAETVLLRIVRGTGPAGLAGIPRTRGPHLRPLLEISRAEILAYCAAKRLPTIADPMNDDRRFARVRARAELVPRLVAENPRFEDALLRLARAAAEWSDVIDARARELAAPRMSIAALEKAGPAIGKRALQLLLPNLEGDHLDRAWALTRAQSGRRADVPGGTIERAFGDLVLVGAPPEGPSELVIDGPDAPYEVRRWRAGDRMRPARLRGRSRKLSDLLADARVPVRERALARVVVRATDGTIVWAEHVGAAANVVISVCPDRSARAPFQ